MICVLCLPLRGWSQNEDLLVVDTIVVSGNDHTKAYIITKQMLLHPGDTITASSVDSLLERSKENILNTGLFLKADCTLFNNTDRQATIQVQVDERWFLFPAPWIDIADRNINYWWFEQNHDLSRLEYGLDMVHYNLTGHADRLNVRAIFGFSQKMELEYERPFLSKDSETGWGLFAMYAANRQIYVNTQYDQQVFMETEDFLRKRIKLGTYVRHRQGPYELHTVEIKYNDTRVSGAMDSLNPEYLGNGAHRLQFMTLGYTFISNRVDNRSYPLEGNYLRAILQKRGFGFFRSGDPDNNTADQIFVSGQWNIYRHLTGKWYAAAMLYGSQNLSAEYPYFLTESLGYCENFVRGYEYYVVDGQGIGLFRSNLRVKAIDKTLHSPIFRNSQFGTIPVQVYPKVFADAGYVSDDVFTSTNTLRNTLLYSAGIGMDITTYYDWVFRFEGAVNALGEFGLYLHLGLDLNTYENCSLW